MSSESSKKRKPKVIQSNGSLAEGKRNRSDTEQEGKYYGEEAEVDLQDPGRDYELMAEIQDLKSGGGKDVAIEIEEQKIQSCMHFMTLKKLNRLLRNLLYEVMHLQKEITKCLEFKSKHEEIDLVSLEEFYKEAPPDISKAEVTVGDPHQQTLAHLDWELEQRKRLAEKYCECLSNKEKILKETEVKKGYLSNLQLRLSSIMQEYLFMPFSQAHKQYETARHLPPPLCVLFVQATAYGQACDKTLSVATEERVEEAKALFKPPEDSQDDESDSDNENV
uniref:THO complex 5 n=1 Tax=Saimiri boliviensis boliviensis TaxID=39432 RepID=A0A2K6UF74_SAIBB